MQAGTSGRDTCPGGIRRHVFFAAGYHPMTVQDHFRVFRRELERFGSVWSAAARCVDAEPIPTATGALWHVEAEGPDWSARARFEMLAWNDIAAADMERPLASHLKGQLRAVADMIASGTLVRYFRASRRYGIFFTLTYVVLALLWGLAAGLGWLTAGLLAPAVGGILAAVAGGAVALTAGFGLMRWPGRGLNLKQSLDLAEFSVDLAHGRHPEVDQRVAAFARRIAEVAASPDIDEVVVAGHSLGAMHVIGALAAALDADPAFGRTVPVRLLTLGSTTAKFALHPAGERLRAAARRVAEAKAIGWLEIQSRDDIVSFYKVDPVTLQRAHLVAHTTAPGDYFVHPLIRHVPIREMITPATYRRFYFDVMRLHCQCFLAGDRRARHDFYAYVCAPVPFDALAADTDGLLAYVDASGRRAGAPNPSGAR